MNSNDLRSNAWLQRSRIANPTFAELLLGFYDFQAIVDIITSVTGKVQVDVADTTPGFLSSKIVSTDGSVVFSITSPGGNETLDLSTSSSSNKVPVRIASTANLGLSGLGAIDGVTPVAGDRILVKNQSTAKNNGIYIAAAGAWSRAGDVNDNFEVRSGMVVVVDEGNTNASTLWELSTPDPITVGVTSLTFVEIGSPLIVSKTLAQIQSFISVSQLQPGQLYYISDRGIYIRAVDKNILQNYGVRVLSSVPYYVEYNAVSDKISRQVDSVYNVDISKPAASATNCIVAWPWGNSAWNNVKGSDFDLTVDDATTSSINNAVISAGANLTLATSSSIHDATILNSAHMNVSNASHFSGTVLFGSVIINNTTSLVNCELGLTNITIGNANTHTGKVANNVSNNFETTVNCNTALSANNLDITTAGYFNYGILNLTSSNATETINKISSITASSYEIELRPSSSLAVTFNGTGVAGIAADQLAMETASTVINGAKGDFIRFRKTTGKTYNQSTGSANFV